MRRCWLGRLEDWEKFWCSANWQVSCHMLVHSLTSCFLTVFVTWEVSLSDFLSNSLIVLIGHCVESLKMSGYGVSRVQGKKICFGCVRYWCSWLCYVFLGRELRIHWDSDPLGSSCLFFWPKMLVAWFPSPSLSFWILLYVDLPKNGEGGCSPSFQSPPRSSKVLLGPLLGPLARGSEKVLAWSPLVPPVHLLQAALLASRATAPQAAAVQGPAPPFIKTAATTQIHLLLLQCQCPP